MAGLDDSTKIYGGRERIIQLRRLLQAYSREDPPPSPQLAIPVSVIKHIQVNASAGRLTSAKAAVADLATIAFFFLLRVGEYTIPAANRRTRTFQFRVQDVTFYHQGRIIRNMLSLVQLMTANGVALCIDNQKNGTHGEIIYQHCLPGHHCCPVAALVRRVSGLIALGGTGDEPISRIPSTTGTPKHATAASIRTLVRSAVRVLGLECQGIDAKRVGSHSLRAGGAMAMKLNDCDLNTIMKSGRWTSLTFLTYVHNQIAHLGANVTHYMAEPCSLLEFLRKAGPQVSGPDTRDAPLTPFGRRRGPYAGRVPGTLRANVEFNSHASHSSLK